MNKEQQIDALEAQVREQHPSWNNADIRNQAVRMFYMDIITVQKITEMIEISCNNLAEHLNKENTNADREYLLGGIHQLEALNQHLQLYIEAELNAAENETRE
jgi:histidinol dehydrogenase